tara:strand:+ start:1020 stop:3131 length:2112 start_codon:yes stop_codon:yes gene_type:complete
MAQYGTVKADFITFTSGTNTDITLTVSSIKNIAETGIQITGNITGKDIIANGNIYVTSGVFIDDTLKVTGVVGIGGETTVSGHFNASGLACVSGLQVLNDATVAGNISVTGSISGNSLFVESGCFASGTKSNPSIYASGDEDTGIYFPNPNQVGFTAEGEERFRVSNGTVFITGILDISKSPTENHVFIGNSIASSHTLANAPTDLLVVGDHIFDFVSGINGNNGIQDQVAYGIHSMETLVANGGGGDNNTIGTQVAYGYYVLQNLKLSTGGAGNHTVGTNVVFGHESFLIQTATGTETNLNVSVGRRNAYANDFAGAAHNSLLGNEAGYSLSSGVGNTLIGSLAGRTVSGQSNNVVIGYLTGTGLTGSNNVVIGYNRDAPNLTEDKQLAIGADDGNWITGRSDFSVTVSGTLSGTVIDATTFSGAFSGNGANITNLNGSAISAGTVPVPRLPIATTSSSGIVQLNNTLTSTSTSLAATAGALKTANDTAEGALQRSGGTISGAVTSTAAIDINNTLTVGDGTTANQKLRIRKVDNNVADHLEFYNGTTLVGEIGVEDSNFLRLNQETNTPVFTPRYIRAEQGFHVGTTEVITSSGRLHADNSTILTAPAISFEGDEDTGIYRPSDNQMGIVSSGVEAVRITEEATPILQKGFGVSNLPSGQVGEIARVTDANSPAVGSTVAGGGAAPALCWYNGTNWTVIGV